MNKIITRPKELEKNEKVLYAGNHYIGIPVIDCRDGSIKNVNMVSMANKALVELEGQKNLLQPFFYRDGKQLAITQTETVKEHYYLPRLSFSLEDGTTVTGRIYADLQEKGFVYEFASSAAVDIRLACNIEHVNLLRFNSHPVAAEMTVKTDKWLGNPVVDIVSPQVSFALAFGGEADFAFSYNGKSRLLNLTIPCKNRNCFYVSINSDPDGASTTLIHLRRKGCQRIHTEFAAWLTQKTISYTADPLMERILNENLFFNYFFAVAKDMESDRYLALTSRSPRYYVSGAFWERDSFLWSFPAIKLVDPRLHRKLAEEMIMLHAKNAGDHAHYIDGTVLYPGFELDEAASYFILLAEWADDPVPPSLLPELEKVLERIEQEYDPATGLYRTFLLPSDDPAEYPLVTIDNVILWRGLKNLMQVFSRYGETAKVEFLQGRAEGIEQGIHKYLTHEVQGKKMFVWAGDGQENYRLYNDPPGNLGLLCFYGFVGEEDPVFKHTVDYYYSANYPYYFANAEIRELACDHHPNTPSGLGLCGSILNPLMREQALEWLKKAGMDHGLLAESFDRNSGEARTGVGFATGAGYLAFALYWALIKERT